MIPRRIAVFLHFCLRFGLRDSGRASEAKRCLLQPENPTLDLLIGVNRLLAEAEKVRSLRDRLIEESKKEVEAEQREAAHASR